LTVRGATVDAIHLPDNGNEKIGVDDFLVAHSVEDFRALPTEQIPCSEPFHPINKKGEGSDQYVNAAAERLIWRLLGQKYRPEYDMSVRTILNRGQPEDHLTMRVMYRGETRIRIGKSAYA
jgi:hypothetical protein